MSNSTDKMITTTGQKDNDINHGSTDQTLAEGDFEVEMDLVDRWKASKFDMFEAFWKQDKVGFGLIGADGEGLCLFNALKLVAQLAGRPNVTTQQDIDQVV
ncbi:unnamed protein product [Phytophthora fragariaefolia]|uniref:Unnamed protein product n=1 Tax=Phytophthora fragariaefolia TaxID=1490495 RepID=A0A9W6YK30_9STRA|nr:unnamed protein product [Phytophthora fragariaefolia]